MGKNQDSTLIEKAKKGDQEAFNCLILKHRAKAVNWAKAITHDAYLAEDVAQDTLLRSLLRLETLEHSDRFLPWLRNMVRNKAIDYLRKSENKLTFIQEESEVKSESSDLNPESLTLRKEFVESISKLSSGLTERNKQIFEAHFFKQQTPEEIAGQFKTTTANVYNILSRSKMKLREETFRVETKTYVNRRRSNHKPSQKQLSPPTSTLSYTSLGHILYEVLKYTSHSTYTLHEVMGLTGQSFRIQMTKDAGLSSSSIYDWHWVTNQIAEVLGCSCYAVGKPGRVPSPELLLRSLDIIHDSIDRGVPAIAWNLTEGEFGLIYGYNCETRTFTYSDAAHSLLEIPYEQLGRNSKNPELFVAALSKPSTEPNLFKSLEAIIFHAKGNEPIVKGYIHGLSAYQTWIEAFENDRADTIGHAYNVALLTEAREHSVSFLYELSEKMATLHYSESAQLFNHAKESFENAHRLYLKLYPAFPYGLPGIKMDISKQAISLLKQIKAFEEQGIGYLEKIILKKSVSLDRKL